MTPTDEDFSRTRERPFDFARLRALTRARDLASTPDEVNDAFGIVSCAFGADWLNSAAMDIPNGRALPFRAHPIGDLLSTAGDAQLAELIELGRYLRLVAPVPRAEALIPALKGSYRSTFFHLAFAAMTIQAGGVVERMEPPGEGGRFGDIDALIGGEPVRIECFRSTFKPDDQNELHLLAKHALAIAKKYSLVMSIGVDVRGELTVKTRRKLTGEISRLTRRFVGAGRSEDLPALLVESDDASVSVGRSVPAPAGAPSCLNFAHGFTHSGGTPIFQRTVYADRSELVGIAGRFEGHPTLSHVAIWLPSDPSAWPVSDAAVADELVRIGRAVENKLAQARDTNGRGRLIAVDAWVTRDLHRLTGSEVTRLRNKIVEKHADVRGLLMMRRDPLRSAPVHGYLLRPLLPVNRAPIAARFLERLSRLANVKVV